MPRMPNEDTKHMYGNLKGFVNDPVNAPFHYNRHQGNIDCISACKASMSKEQYIGLLKGSALQYLWRFDLKNGLQDLEKTQFYLKELIAEVNTND